MVGGISGCSYGDDAKIIACFNSGEIYNENHGAGGICCYHSGGVILNCYNTGTIYGLTVAGGINGNTGYSGYQTAYTRNCYNIGSVNGNNYVGNITGEASIEGGIGEDINCYSQDVTVELLNSGEFSENAWTSDVKNEDETWKYNNGYPILKWQLNN